MEEKIFVPKGWTKEVWIKFSALIEGMTKEELAESFRTLGVAFVAPDEKLSKEDFIGVADELIEKDVREYFKI